LSAAGLLTRREGVPINPSAVGQETHRAQAIV